MDIYEALEKLRENKKVDRVAQRKKLVEKKLNESKKVGKKPLKEGLYDGAENVDDLIYLYIRDQLFNQKVYRDDVMNFLEEQGLDPDYIYEYDIDDDYIETALEDAIDRISDYFIRNSHSPSANESLSEATHRYATKWAVIKRGYYDNGKGDGGLLYDKKKEEIVKEFEGEGNGYTAEKDAYAKANELANKLNKKEGKFSNGENRYVAKPMNTTTTKL